MDVDVPHRRARVAAGRAIPGHVARLAVVLGVALAGPVAIAAEPTPDPSPTGPPPIPAPATVGPPAAAPFDGVVGGEDLGRIGEPVVSAGAPPLPEVDAFAWLIADVDTGDVLAAFSPHEPRPPASTIKLLTAITAAPRLDVDDTYVADTAPESIIGSRAGIVAEGRYTVDDLMHGLLLPSGNDAAYALGELLGGQEETLDLMNETARALGAFDTHAASPHGLDTPGQVSSAYDLALIGRAALAEADIAVTAQAPAYDFPGRRDGETFQIQNQNRLLGSYDGAIGLKTGYTTQAGHTFVGAAERDGRRLIATILAAEGRAEDSAATLFDWAFAATGEDDIDPVGHLVTPDDVEQAETDDGVADDIDDTGHGAAGGAADGAAGKAVHTITDGATNRPLLMWGAVAALAAGGVGAMTLKRRRRPAGRYAAGRR